MDKFTLQDLFFIRGVLRLFHEEHAAYEQKIALDSIINHFSIEIDKRNALNADLIFRGIQPRTLELFKVTYG